MFWLNDGCQELGPHLVMTTQGDKWSILTIRQSRTTPNGAAAKYIVHNSAFIKFELIEGKWIINYAHFVERIQRKCLRWYFKY